MIIYLQISKIYMFLELLPQLYAAHKQVISKNMSALSSKAKDMKSSYHTRYITELAQEVIDSNPEVSIADLSVYT